MEGILMLALTWQSASAGMIGITGSPFMSSMSTWAVGETLIVVWTQVRLRPTAVGLVLALCVVSEVIARFEGMAFAQKSRNTVPIKRTRRGMTSWLSWTADVAVPATMFPKVRRRRSPPSIKGPPTYRESPTRSVSARNTATMGPQYLFCYFPPWSVSSSSTPSAMVLYPMVVGCFGTRVMLFNIRLGYLVIMDGLVCPSCGGVRCAWCDVMEKHATAKLSTQQLVFQPSVVLPDSWFF